MQDVAATASIAAKHTAAAQQWSHLLLERWSYGPEGCACSPRLDHCAQCKEEAAVTVATGKQQELLGMWCISVSMFCLTWPLQTKQGQQQSGQHFSLNSFAPCVRALLRRLCTSTPPFTPSIWLYGSTIPNQVDLICIVTLTVLTLWSGGSCRVGTTVCPPLCHARSSSCRWSEAP